MAGQAIRIEVELLTAQEVADIARVHYRTFRRWCKDGDGPRATTLGGVERFARADVEAWLMQCRGSDNT